MAPEPGGIRPAVQEQDRVAVAMILDVQADPVKLKNLSFLRARHDPDDGTCPLGWSYFWRRLDSSPALATKTAIGGITIATTEITTAATTE
jgi:hypothetical protein